ncbi:MAG: HD domain-containing protein [Anaerolineae bacterium]|nr:HD domain-containing protein [Anaerolineae bacterium]
MTFGAAGLRLRQGTRALSAFARPLEISQAEAVLTADEFRLFQRMRRSEQLHSLNVLASAHANDSVTLAQAALLHDVGKIRYPLHLWQRTLTVLVGAVSRPLLRRLSQRDPRPAWSRGFVVHARHPEWGAELAAQAGASDDVVWLVRHHADDPQRWATHPMFGLLVRLKQADDLN